MERCRHSERLREGEANSVAEFTVEMVVERVQGNI